MNIVVAMTTGFEFDFWEDCMHSQLYEIMVYIKI